MAIRDTINSIKQHIEDAYGIAEEKQATIPEQKNLENLADCISSISGGGNYQSKQVTITQNGTITVEPDTGYDAMDSVEITTNVEGGGKPSYELGAVTFFDYDGNIIANLSYDELENLSELPELPTHDDLIPVEWTATLEEVKSVISPDRLEVGVLYNEVDSNNGESTILYLEINQKEIPITIQFMQTVSNGVKINWGDGSEIETVDGTTASATHTYNGAEINKSKIKLILTPDSDCTMTLGTNSSSGPFISSSIINLSFRKIFIGRCKIGNYCFSSNFKLNYAILSKKVMNIGANAFDNCYGLQHITIPNNTTIISINANCFNKCYGLKHIILPNNISSFGTGAFYYCYGLISIVIPKKVTLVTNNLFYFCYSLQHITIPNSITSLSNTCLAWCSSLKTIYIKNNITNIGTNAFLACSSLKELYFDNRTNNLPTSEYMVPSYGGTIFNFSECTQIPSITSTNTFKNIKLSDIILVPDELYDNWIVASGWSDYANYIVKVSEYNI